MRARCRLIALFMLGTTPWPLFFVASCVGDRSSYETVQVPGPRNPDPVPEADSDVRADPHEQAARQKSPISVDREPDPKGTLFGKSVCALGDVDADGFDDFAIGAPVAWSKAGRTGSVLVISGREYRVLYRLDGPEHNSGFGDKLVTVGDLDQDGTTDFAVGTFHENFVENFIPISERKRGVHVVSGQTGTILHSFEMFSRCLGVCGDLDSDGVGDLVLQCDYPAKEAEYTVVVSGRSGEVLWTKPPPRTASIHLVGDLDDDGFSELVLAPLPHAAATTILSTQTGQGRVLSPLGRTEGVLTDGFQCLSADVDNDGLSELVYNASDVATGKGQLVAVDRDGIQVRVADIQAVPPSEINIQDYFRYFIHSPGDLDGDGGDDLVVGSLPFGPTHITAFSGMNGERLWSLRDMFGNNKASFAALRDRTGDGAP